MSYKVLACTENMPYEEWLELRKLTHGLPPACGGRPRTPCHMRIHPKRFSNVEATTAAKRAIEEFAAVQTGGAHFCPRCGEMSVKEKLCTNALSRHVHVYVCDRCGMDEALRELSGKDLPLREWAVAKLRKVDK